jgi:multimeric flavodoxin WrbA
MQILGITSSPRKKSNTACLVTAILEGAQDRGCETTEISLPSYDIGFCKGCEACYRTGSCILIDDFCDVIEVILASDGIVMSSPNYINNVTGRMKVLLDRMGDTIHCQRLIGKYVAAVSTAGGSGAAEVAAYLNQTLYLMGADVVGQVSVNMVEGEEAFTQAAHDAYQLGITLADSVQSGKPITQQQAGHEEMLDRMRALILSRSDDWVYELGYYQNKKWL